MRKAFGALSWAVLLAISSVSMAAPPASPPPNAGGDAALAERLAEMGRGLLRGNITRTHYRLAAAMMEAAARLAPAERRYPRLWADAALQAADGDNALRALKAYTALAPEDKSAMIQLADLYARDFQTVDARLAYLTGIVDVAGLAPEVRSHVAFLMYEAFTDRAQTTQAAAAIDKALKLNPLNMDALRVRYEMAADGAPAERLAALLDLLRANPAQVGPMARVAQELSDAGLALQSLPFYERNIALSQRQGAAVQREFVLAYATELALVTPGQLQTASQLSKQLTDFLTNADAGDYEALLLRLLVQRQNGAKEDAAKTTQQALNALSNRIQATRQLLGNKAATTRPVDSTDPLVLGSLEEDIKNLKELKPSEKIDPQHMTDQFAGLLAEMAWFQTYFNAKPAEAQPYIDALRKVLPENSPTVVRLEGWSFLAKGEKDQAKVKLSAVKDKDPIAELGLLKMRGPEAKKDADAFLAGHPTGLLAVETLDALKEDNVALIPDPAKTNPLLGTLKGFPQTWLGVLDNPQNFYVLRAEPAKVPHLFGEPLLAKVTILNVSDMPITIGADGLLRPELLVDAQLQGVLGDEMQKDFPAIAVDRVSSEMVLQPKKSVAQIIRVDQGPLSQMLTANAAPSLQVTFDVRSNATAGGVGPAGQIATSPRFLDRASFPLSAESIAKLTTGFPQATPAEKIRILDLSVQIVSVLSQQQGNPDTTKAVEPLKGLIVNARNDPSESVQAWANAIIAPLLSPAERGAFFGRLGNDPYWATRIIGMYFMVGALPIQEQRTIYKGIIEHDTNPIVVEVAKDLSELVEKAAVAAASQPTTSPASTSGPATAPSPLTPGAQRTEPTTSPTTAPGVTIPAVPLTLPPPAPASATQPGH